MTPEEFKAWINFQKESSLHWLSDPIREANGQGYLFFKGGISGTYIEIRPDGQVTIGQYEDAIPHMGEALYRPQHGPTKLGNTAEQALGIITERLGLAFLLDLVGCR